MVKTRSLFSALFIVASAAIVSSCSARGPFATVTAESIVLSNGSSAPFLSVACSSGTVSAVYADRATTTLNIVEVPGGPHLPQTAPAPEVIDKVDVLAPLSPAFGALVFSVGGGNEGVLYLDRETEAKSVLKLATRQVGTRQWNLDILEPAGDPLALIPDEKGGFNAVWSSGLLSSRSAGGDVAPLSQQLPFKLQGRASPDGSGGFTAWDSLTSSLLSVRYTGPGYAIRTIDECSPVHASLRAASGLLSVATWNASARRLILHHEVTPGGNLSSATVTVCDGTEAVVLLRGLSDSTYIVLFDEIRPVAAGRIVSQVSLVAPGTLIGARGTRYRKAVITSGDAPIDGFAAARTSDALYVLVSQGNLRLLRIPLFP